MVREAGGFVTDLDGGDAVLTKGHVAAGNDTMHRELLRLIKEAGKEAAKEATQEATKEGNKDVNKDGSNALAASPAGRAR